MSTTINFYNQAVNRFNDPGVDASNLKVMLRDGTTFDATQTDVSQLDGEEVHGNNWSEGGEPIPNASFSITETNNGELTGDNIAKTATGGDIGPTDIGLIIEDDGENPPALLFALVPDTSQTASEGTPFIIEWTNGQIAKWSTS